MLPMAAGFVVFNFYPGVGEFHEKPIISFEVTNQRNIGDW